MASGDKHLSGEERALIETQARLAHPAQKPPRRRSQLPAHGRGPLENHERRRILPHPPRHPPSNPSPARRHLHPSPPSPRPGNPGNPHRPRPGPLLRRPLLPLTPPNRVPGAPGLASETWERPHRARIHFAHNYCPFPYNKSNRPRRILTARALGECCPEGAEKGSNSAPHQLR